MRINFIILFVLFKSDLEKDLEKIMMLYICYRIFEMKTNI